jgi:hypothetical protein
MLKLMSLLRHACIVMVGLPSQKRITSPVFGDLRIVCKADPCGRTDVHKTQMSLEPGISVRLF